MIVLDEQLQGLGIEAKIKHWYRGSVVLIQQLRPGTVVKDEAFLRCYEKPRSRRSSPLTTPISGANRPQRNLIVAFV